MFRELGSRFDHVLVDEYQDTNRLQANILLKLKPDGRGVTVVGDDAQSIYSFRAATVRNILDFPDQFEPPARIITLEQNYRSTQPILDACNSVIGFAEERFTKNLRSDRKSKQRPFLTTVADETAQARYVAQQILDAREAGVPLKSQAVLFRASHHSAQLEIELSRRNIPFVKYGGLKFLEAAHVKDVLSVFRWCENPTDRVAGFRVVETAARHWTDHGRKGSGPGRGADRKGPIFSSQSRCRNQRPKTGLRLPTCSRMRKAKTTWPAEFQLVRQWYEPHLQRMYDDAHLRLADIAQLEQIAAGYESRERFLTELTLDPPDATSGQPERSTLDEDYTILSTIHSAKGQEWRSVRILNAVDGCIPSDMATRTPRRDRRRTAAAVRGDDAGEGRAGPDRAAAVLHPSAEQAWRSARLCVPQPVDPGQYCDLVRLLIVGTSGYRLRTDQQGRCHNRCCRQPAPDVAISGRCGDH